MPVTVIDHPLVARHLVALRDRDTSSAVFRQRLADVSMLLLFEALRDLRVEDGTVTTPLDDAPARRLRDDIVVVAILRAGLGMVDGALHLVPEARVGHIGMFRDEEALRPVGYYENLPRGIEAAEVVLMDPMLATGGSAIAAAQRLYDVGVERLRMVCLVAAPEGLEKVAARLPGLHITCAVIDDRLDEHGYIRPGLGDAGDRLYGTH